MSDGELISQSGMLFITLFAMMLGLIFTVIPILPGTLIIWAAALVYGLVLGWENLGWWTFGLITFFMILGIVADVSAGHFGAKMGGASWLAVIVGAVLGFVLGLSVSIFGTPLLGCFAGLLGAIGGVLWIEWRRNKDWDAAIRATKGYFAGSVAGIIAKVISGVFMFGIFLARVYLWP
ncbi:MAG TPA: DUF456 domain-containing protein [Anaerolineae bacterium]|nr:DUF456 domain-containing protein [Anaerolineae bacterium]HXW00441.1 DUF456 domain-containing protein [Anaerolineae bacterium]